MFGKRSTDHPARIPTIIVPQSAYDSEADYALPGAVVDFVNHVLNQAMYQRTEIPAAAMQVFHVDYYIAQVNNGGHSQYVGNSGWHDYQIADIRAGLAAIGISEAIELYEDLCAFADSHPEQFMAGMKAHGFGVFPEFFDKADKLFFNGLNNRLARGNSNRARLLDCLMVVPSEQYGQLMDGLAARNPYYKTRKADQEERKQAALEKDPIVQACRYLGARAEPPLEVERWLQGAPEEGPEGVKGARFTVRLSDDRITTAFLFPSFGEVVQPDGVPGRRPIPMDQVQEHVKEQTGDFLPRDLWH